MLDQQHSPSQPALSMKSPASSRVSQSGYSSDHRRASSYAQACEDPKGKFVRCPFSRFMASYNGLLRLQRRCKQMPPTFRPAVGFYVDFRR